MSTRIAVVDCSTDLGGAAADYLRDRGHPVRALSPDVGGRAGHDPAPPFSWDDRGTWSEALSEVRALVLALPEDQVEPSLAVRRLIGRAVASGVTRVISLSAMGVDDFPGHPFQNLDAAVREMSPEWAVLRPSWVMQHFTEGLFRPMLALDGTLATPCPRSRVSFVDRDDVMACAAALLTAPRGDGRLAATYELTGGQAITFPEAAATLARHTGEDIRYTELDLADPALGPRMRMPYPTFLVHALFVRVRSGAEAGLTSSVETLLGRPPTTLADFAARPTTRRRLVPA